MKNISFDNPYLLLLLIPFLLIVTVPIIITIRKENKSRSVFISMALHIVIALCITLAIAGMAYTTVITETEVYVVADVSHSSSLNLDQIDEYIDELQSKLPKNSKLGVITFGKDYKLICAPGEEFTTVKDSGIDASATDISSALDHASGLFSEGVIKRVVLITDGKETHTDAEGRLVAAVDNLYSNDVFLDVIFLDNNLPDDQREVQISSVLYPESTYMDHDTTADVLIQSTYDTDAVAVLYVNGERYKNHAISLEAGYNYVSFDLPSGSTGRYDYRIAIQADGDRVTANNAYDFTQRVEGRLNVLLVSGEEADLARAEELYGSNAVIDAYINEPNVPCGIDELIKYDEIILSNVDVRELNNYTAFIDGIDKAVSQFGKSLVTMGDLRIQNKTDDILKQLEDMLPVKYGNDDQDPKLYAVVLDISRSMQNFSRLRIAKEAAIQLVNMLKDKDQVMVVVFHGEYTVLQTPVDVGTYRESVIDLIAGVEPQQGTVIGTALKKAGEYMIKLPYHEKQVMLISDGMSFSLEKDDPVEVAAELYENGILTSVIRPATRETGSNDKLSEIAEAGGGSYFEIVRETDVLNVMFSDIADELTDSVINGVHAVKLHPDDDKLGILEGIDRVPAVNGFAYAGAKASASCIMSVEFQKSDGKKVDAPLYSYWEYGNGRVSSFMSSFTGEWTEAWQGENGGGAFFSNLLECHIPKEQTDDPFSVNVTYDGTYSEFTLEPMILDPYAVTEITVTAPDGTNETQRLSFDSRRYYHRFETPMYGKYVIDISYSHGDKVFESQKVFHLSYSPEYDSFALFDPAILHAAVRDRGNVYEGEVPTIQNDEDMMATYTVLFAPILMLAAVILYVIDIMVRKLKLNDIKSFFGIKQKGGKR